MRSNFALSPAEKVDARAALRLLEGSGVSLEEAARRAIAGRRAVRRLRVSEAVGEFVRSKIDGRARTLEFYQDRLRLVEARFGAQWFDDVTRAALFDWIRGLEGSAGTRAATARAVRALWRWGMTTEPQLVGIDITAGLPTRGPSNGGDAEFLKVEEVAQIMGAATTYRSALAVLFFAGVRPDELAGRQKERLKWKHVSIERREIRIPGDISKTKKPRIIEGLPDAVWAWIAPGASEDPISPGRSRQAIESAQAAIVREDWPHDATRHTFCTYALAAVQDAGRVSTWSGHEGRPTTLHRHYRGLATKDEGDRFFALRP